ncbi:hypothetical protein [Streptomyces griseus]|uniref:hypothetical protein n=1 Tax=Streptomyces griseus TaxID=1911 RepID=UPI0033C2BFBC
MLNVSAYAKAVVAAVVAGVAALSVAIQDGNLTTGDGVTVVLAVLGALGVTYVVPNKDADA